MNPYASPSPLAGPASNPENLLAQVPPPPRVPSPKAKRYYDEKGIYPVAIIGGVFLSCGVGVFIVGMKQFSTGGMVMGLIVAFIGLCFVALPISSRRDRRRAFRDGAAIVASVVSFDDWRDKHGKVSGKKLMWRGVDSAGRQFEGTRYGQPDDFPQPEYAAEMPIVVLFDPSSRASTLWIP